MTRPLRIWLIDEGSHGHRAQSEGVVAALEAEGRTVETLRIPCRERIPGALRPLARAAMEAGGPLSPAVARLASIYEAPQGPAPDLVISSGGATAFANRALAARTGALSVFVGVPKPFPPGWFDLVMTPLPLGLGSREIVTEIVPNPMTPGRLAAAASGRWPGGAPASVWTLLVGGDSRNHRFEAADVEALAEGANALAAQVGIRWLVTTSRRTGEAFERLLEARLAPEAVAEATLFGRRPEPVTAAYLGAGERIFVTQDSLTMLSEAMASGRPVTALAPSRVDLAPENPMARMLERWTGAGFLSRRPCRALAGFDPAGAPPPETAPAEAMARAARALLERLDARRGRLSS